MEQKLLTVKETAELTRLGIQTVRLYVWKGLIPVVRIGRRTLIPREELEKWINSKFHPAKNETETW